MRRGTKAKTRENQKEFRRVKRARYLVFPRQVRRRVFCLFRPLRTTFHNDKLRRFDETRDIVNCRHRRR